MKKLGFGIMRLPLLVEGDQSKVDKDKARAMIDRYIEKGYSYFDTAYNYHGETSEAIVKELITDRHPRDKFTVTDKLPWYALERDWDYEETMDGQLKKTGLDYFDIYFIHNFGARTYKIAQETGVFDFMSRMKEKGKAKRIGFSWHDSPELLDEILTAHPEVEIVQLQINFCDWEDPGIRARENHEVCVKHGVDITIMEPLKGGALTSQLPPKAQDILEKVHPGMPLVQWGLRFAASQKNVIKVLSGMSTLEQVEENTSFMDDPKPLTQEEQAAILEVGRILQESIEIPCTACQYCTKDCPKNIAIPLYFSIYNNVRIFRKHLFHTSMFENTAAKGGKPSDCIKCGKCEANCPQRIPIRENLKKVAKEFE